VFDAREPESLVALLMARLGPGLTNDHGRVAALRLLDHATKRTLERGGPHEPAIDIAGAAWAEAFGVLPLAEPARPQLEWVLTRGAQSGAVRGALGLAWRARFLAAVRRQLDSSERPRAEAELERRLEALAGKLPPLGPTALQQGPSSAELRLTAVLLDTRHERFRSIGAAFAESVLDATSSDDAPSIRLGQALLAARALGRQRQAEQHLSRLIARRLESGLVRADDASGRPELSPWVPLALVASGATAAPAL
jgi:hypothetical protein